MQNPSLKYQLPSEPNVYVDLVDDEDTQLMFDDWHDYSSSTKNASKLHFFIDWRKDPSRSSSEAKQPNLGTIESVESLERQSSRNSAGHYSFASCKAIPQNYINLRCCPAPLHMKWSVVCPHDFEMS